MIITTKQVVTFEIQEEYPLVDQFRERDTDHEWHESACTRWISFERTTCQRVDGRRTDE